MRGAIDADARGARHPRISWDAPSTRWSGICPTARLHSRPAGRQRPYPRARCQLDGARAAGGRVRRRRRISAPCPMLVDSPEMAAALRRDPHVHKTIDMFDRLTKAVVGIGAWTASGSTVRARCLRSSLQSSTQPGPWQTSARPSSTRAAASLVPPLPNRFIAISPQQLRAVPDVVAIAAGPRRRPHPGRPPERAHHRLITDEEAPRCSSPHEGDDSSPHEDDSTNGARSEDHDHGAGLPQRHATRPRSVRRVAGLDPRLRLRRRRGLRDAAGSSPLGGAGPARRHAGHPRAGGDDRRLRSGGYEPLPATTTAARRTSRSARRPRPSAPAARSAPTTTSPAPIAATATQ